MTGRLLTITFAGLLYFTGIGMLFPVLPRFVTGPLGGTNVEVGLVAGAFSFSAVLMRPFAGRIGDRRGRGILMVAGATLAAAAVALYTQVSTIWPLVALRLVDGIGEASFFVGSTTAVSDLAPAERRGEAISLYSVGIYSGLSAGPLAGEILLEEVGFQSVWLASAGMGMLAALLATRLGAIRPESEEGGGGSLIHVGALVPGLILAASIWGFAGFSSFVPLYALALGLSGSRYLFMLRSLIILVIRVFGSRIPDRVGPKKTAVVSLSVSAAGLALMGAAPGPFMLVAGTVVFALGQALAFPALLSIVMQGVSPGRRGAVIGTFTAFLDVAFGLGPVTLGFVAEAAGYPWVFYVSAGVAVAGVVVLLRSKPAPVAGL